MMKASELLEKIMSANGYAMRAAFEAGFKAGFALDDCTAAEAMDEAAELSEAWGRWISELDRPETPTGPHTRDGE